MADPILILILHNDNPLAMIDGYMYGDPLTMVYRDTKCLPHREYAEVSLNYVYAENQWVDEAHRPWYDDARSLSKGDVIVLQDKAYTVASIGFDEVKISVEGLVL
jgi:hypothetical protein